MGRTPLALAAILPILFFTVGCTGGSAAAAPQPQAKAETPGAAPQKPGGQAGQAQKGAGGPASAQGAGRIVSAATVNEGKVQLVFTYNGTVQSRFQVNVAPKASGRVEEIRVDVGQQLKAGDPIAVLEHGSLELAVQQAEANLKSAQAKLATVLAGGRPEDIASAEAGVASARAKLSQTRNGPTSADLQAAQSTLEAGRATLAAAEARLEVVKAGPTQAEWASATATLDSSRAAFRSAEAKLEQVKAGGTQAEWATALAAQESSRATLRSAQAKLDQVKAGPTAADLASAQKDVDSAKSAMITAEDKYQLTLDDKLSASGATSNSAAKQAFDAAKASYEAALQKLNQLASGPTAADLAAAQSAFDSAQANYSAAAAKVEQMRQGPLPADLAAAQSSYDSARGSFEAAQAKIEQMKNTPTPQDLQQAQSTVDAARASLASAEAKLAQVQRGPTAEELTIAEAALIQAEQTRALKRQPYTDQDIQTAQASLEVARVALAVANSQLADATLVAPFDGVVTQRLLSVGAMASSGSPVITLASTDPEITVSVEESRMAQLRPGLEAAISTPAFPGQTIPGKVVNISPSADSKSHTFTMKVVSSDSQGRLKSGMYADLKITAEERSGALLVPRDAVTQRNGKDVVFAIVDGKAQMREVVQGIPQNGNVEITSGVKAGEQVVVVGHGGLNEGDPVRVSTPAGAGQPADQTQQRRPGAPTKAQ